MPLEMVPAITGKLALEDSACFFNSNDYNFTTESTNFEGFAAAMVGNNGRFSRPTAADVWLAAASVAHSCQSMAAVGRIGNGLLSVGGVAKSG